MLRFMLPETTVVAAIWRKGIFQYRILWWNLVSKLKLNQCRRNFIGHKSWRIYKLVITRCRYKSVDYRPMTVSNILRQPVAASNIKASCLRHECLFTIIFGINMLKLNTIHQIDPCFIWVIHKSRKESTY